MQLSARIQLNPTVEEVTHGQVMSVVKVALPDGQHVTAAMTRKHRLRDRPRCGH
jgi:molybdopterin-binding protein